MDFEAKPVALVDLVNTVRGFKGRGYRFVTMSCVDLGENLDLIYHFDRDLVMSHIRLTVPKQTPVPSISEVYFAAVLIENETKDHFGVPFENLALDFQGMFYLEDEIQKHPFCKISVAEEDGSEEDA